MSSKEWMISDILCPERIGKDFAVHLVGVLVVEGR
jgi:hypothetical protein